LSGQPDFTDDSEYNLTAAVERYEPSASGDPSKSAALYASTCAECHGDAGEGVWTVNAPSLAGLEDWYLATQIKNFRDGVRGRHSDDLYGLQMGLVSNTMTDDQMIEDMVAYIVTLGESTEQPVKLAQQR